MFIYIYTVRCVDQMQSYCVYSGKKRLYYIYIYVEFTDKCGSSLGHVTVRWLHIAHTFLSPSVSNNNRLRARVATRLSPDKLPKRFHFIINYARLAFLLCMYITSLSGNIASSKNSFTQAHCCQTPRNFSSFLIIPSIYFPNTSLEYLLPLFGN